MGLIKVLCIYLMVVCLRVSVELPAVGVRGVSDIFACSWDPSYWVASSSLGMYCHFLGHV